MVIDGKPVWIRPKFAKPVGHLLQNSIEELTVMAGTQIIDKFWEEDQRCF